LATILVIDDDARMRRMIGRMLAAAGHAVVEAAEGEAGLRQFRARRPAVVITDILMPGREGIETILEIRRLAPDAKIIAISGGGHSGDADFLEMAEHLGADATLAKPFAADELTEALRRLLPASAGEPGQR
jgi:two-component system, chemotaxis family, chemotaxis protein CheY